MPVWAKTEGQIAKEKDQEIDDLIEFAYELDYEKFVEDMEVRQALALIKDRVEEMKADWNAPAQVAGPTHEDVSDMQSVKSNVSWASWKPRRQDNDETLSNPDWNRSTKNEERAETPAEKLAGEIAEKVLNDNPQLRGIHSKHSLK